MEKQLKTSFLSLFGLAIISLNFLAIVLSLLGVFYVQIIAFYLVAIVLFFAYYFFSNSGKFVFSQSIFIVILSSLLLIYALSYFSVPTIFSGRDQGSFSEAAIRLSENHQLKFKNNASDEFFKLYGPGRALDFPGFNYTKDGYLTSHFPIGYISWLAIFYSFFGLSGFAIANGLTLFLFFISFYFLSRFYLSKRISLSLHFLILTSFVFSWFFKFTLSENLALALIWFGLYQFIKYEKYKGKTDLYLSFFSFAVLAFSRVESFAFLLVIVAYLYYKNKKSLSPLKKLFSRNILAALAAIVLVYILNLFVSLEFFRELARGALNSFANNSEATENSSNIFLIIWYLLKIFLAYGIFVYLILGLGGIFLLFREKSHRILLPFLIISPSFIYLINPSISLDHPWMLRRFCFAIIPALMFYSLVFLDKYVLRKTIFWILFALLLSSNILFSWQYFPFSENENMLGQIQKIGQNFKNTDLILVDQTATGDGWSMMTGPLGSLYEKQAVYLVNPEDLNKIDRAKFSQIYLIIPEDRYDYYKNMDVFQNFSQFRSYSIDAIRLNVSFGKKNDLIHEKVTIPNFEDTIVYGNIYILE
jgi:hypothetical protein